MHSTFLIIVSAADTFGESPKGKGLLQAQTDAELGKIKLDEATSLAIAQHAIDHLQGAIKSIHPGLLDIFSRNMLKECIKRSVSDAPAAMPFTDENLLTTAGLVILGRESTSARQLLAKIALISETDIVATPTATAAEIEHLVILHEAFHMRKNVSWAKELTDLEIFIEEVKCDRFALREAAKLPGHEPAIEEYVNARSLIILHGGAPQNSSGLALATLTEDATEEQYRALFETAQSFRQKVIEHATDNIRKDFSSLPPAVQKLLGTNQKYSLAEGISVVKDLQHAGGFIPLENQMAVHYLQAAEKWLTPTVAQEHGNKWTCGLGPLFAIHNNTDSSCSSLNFNVKK